MSRHHYAIAHDQEHLVYDIEHLENSELQSLYGIHIYEDKTVYDPVEDMTFSNLQDWAAYQIKAEEWDEASHPHETSRKFDDEF